MLIPFYLLTVLAANLAVTYIGPVSVGFGLIAPAGVYFVGLVLVLRDLVHERHGLRGSLLAVALGSLLSLVLADPAVAIASVVAFVVAELLDLAAFVPARARWGLPAAVLLSGVVGSAIDSWLFLSIAFGDLGFFWGQLVGKLAMTLLAAAVLVLVARRREVVSS